MHSEASLLRGFPTCSYIFQGKTDVTTTKRGHPKTHFSRFRRDWPNLGNNIPRITSIICISVRHGCGMMQAMPGMLSTMGTPRKTLVFDSAGSRSKNDPFSPKTHPLAARSQRKSIAHGRRMVGGGRRHRAAGPVPEGRPSGPRPSAVSRTTGSEAPRQGNASPCN